MFDSVLDPVTNFDEIVDFAPNDDVILLDNDVFAGISLGVLALGRFHVGAAAANATERIIYDDATGVIFYDVDGSGAANQVRFAYVDAGLVLNEADFVVVA